jgi:uncharacterized protein (UPF0261 family)
METLLRQGEFVGIIDLSPHEVIDHRYGGLAGAPDRFESLTKIEVPAVVSVGGIDHLLFETLEKAPTKYHKRAHVVHHAGMTAVAPTPRQMVAAAREIIERLNRALGPTIVLLPLRGFSELNRSGGELYLPKGNRAVVREFLQELRPDIPIVQADLHINDLEFANLVSMCMARLLKGESPQDIGPQFGATLAGRGRPL